MPMSELPLIHRLFKRSPSRVNGTAFPEDPELQRRVRELKENPDEAERVARTLPKDRRVAILEAHEEMG